MKPKKTLDQIRANHALAAADQVRKESGEGNALAGYPSLIMNNGLLAALAYSIEKKKQHRRIADAIATHLAKSGFFSSEEPSAKSLLDKLTSSDADALILQQATSEALAFLAFLKRFAS